MSDTTNPITHVFDQTNGVIDGLEGESDGTAAGELQSPADRDQDDVQDGDRPRAHDASDRSTADPAPADAVVESTTTATSGARARPDSEEDGTEHVFAVDRSGAATDEGPDSSAPDARVEEVSTQEFAEVDDDATAVSSRRQDTAVVDGYDSGPASQVGGTERDADAAPTAAVAATDADDAGGTGTTGSNGLAALIADDDSIGHVFDQTNGVVDGVEGESDGTAEGDDESAGDERGLNEPNPVGQQDAFHDDHYGAADGRDPNP